ncbi:Glutathione S-transferase S1 [Linnemannia gamsii]|uniref:Glutathione S-transferase S1 n=1 Tax=Linnemannia gamsii TaxID=64522 RepID=A0ABQ7K4T5_9FUNG|nr:Glutathione S-transferase S1 [Linnemannia gamsii]
MVQIPSASTNLSSGELSALAVRPDGKFVITYFAAHGLALTTRALLCVVGAEWEDNMIPLGPWFPEHKTMILYGTVPVLHEKFPNGQVLEIGEVAAIENYIAQKFHMVPESPWDQVRHNEALSLSETLFRTWIIRANPNMDHNAHVSTVELFKTRKLPEYIQVMEKLLIKNGDNGHLVGDKFTHADVFTSAVLDCMISMRPFKDVLNKETSPGLFKLKSLVDAHPKYSAYRKSEAYAVASEGMSKFFSQEVFDFDFARTFTLPEE